MKSPLNILSALALASAALTVLPACKAVPKDAAPAEPPPAVAEAPAETSHTWFAKKGQRRRAKAETPAPTAVAEPVDTAHWGRRSRTTPRFPRHREMRAFVSCMA